MVSQITIVLTLVIMAIINTASVSMMITIITSIMVFNDISTLARVGVSPLVLQNKSCRRSMSDGRPNTPAHVLAKQQKSVQEFAVGFEPDPTLKKTAT